MDFQPVPLPVESESSTLSDESLGWLKGTVAPTITAVAILIGLGHSLLAMSGFETLAQVYREIASPKLKNLKRAGNVIFLYSMLFTSLASFFAVMLIPDSERPKYLDNLLGGLSMFLVGPVGVEAAVSCLRGGGGHADSGGRGEYGHHRLERRAEPRGRRRRPAGLVPQAAHEIRHHHRLINTVVLLQIVTIVLSRGDVNLLGEAYAFGVVWSFSFNALSVLVLRFKQPENREWKVPLNFRIGGVEIPVGLGLITLFLFTLACINVFTKELATIAGVSFTLAFFLVFTVSERMNRTEHARKRQDLEQFRLDQSEEVSQEQITCAAGQCAGGLPQSVPSGASGKSAREDRYAEGGYRRAVGTSGDGGGFGRVRSATPIRSSPTAEQDLFTRVVSVAEKAGKHVELLAVAAADPWLGMVQTAQKLQSSRIVTGFHRCSPTIPPNREKWWAKPGNRWSRRARRFLWKLFFPIPTNRCSSIWGRIRRGYGRKMSIWCTGSGWNWLARASGPGFITGM